jgi:hypothetical protein
LRSPWQKLGLVFDPHRFDLDWMRTHAQNPTPEAMEEGAFKVYFSGRDANNHARGGFFVFNINRPSEILDLSIHPILDLGTLGAFDDAGVMPSCIVHRPDGQYLYYTGWSRSVDVPFAFHIGLAISKAEGDPFVRASPAPVIGRNRHDPYITGAPFVLIENGRFKMWYVSGTKWEKTGAESKPRHYYTVKYAESDDGLTWQTNEDLCIPYSEAEYAIARPVVRRLNDHYEMWFTYRGGANTYRLGCATSREGRQWERAPGPSIDPSPSGWDSEMICYGYPFPYDGREYALYNGNDYGATGVGLAVVNE